MAKKRKRSSDCSRRCYSATVEKPDNSAPQRPERTLFGFKDQPDLAAEHISKVVGPFFRNKEKVLITCSCHIIYRYRHLMQNVVLLLRHAKKDSKVESKESKDSALNELVELRSCSSFLFFDKPHWKLLKEMITKNFATPKDHRKAKPFHDHVFVFSIVDDHIWFRNYQISVPHNEIDKVDKGGLDKITLVESTRHTTFVAFCR